MTRFSNLLSGAIGGLLVLVVGAVLIATDVIDVGETKTVVRQTPDRAARVEPATPAGKTVAEIYKRGGPRRGVRLGARRAGGAPRSSASRRSRRAPPPARASWWTTTGTIVTNAHVVEGSNDVTVSFEEDGDPIEAEVKGRDPSTDLAVLKVDPDKIENARAGAAGRLERRRRWATRWWRSATRSASRAR